MARSAARTTPISSARTSSAEVGIGELLSQRRKVGVGDLLEEGEWSGAVRGSARNKRQRAETGHQEAQARPKPARLLLLWPSRRRRGAETRQTQLTQVVEFLSVQ